MLAKKEPFEPGKHRLAPTFNVLYTYIVVNAPGEFTRFFIYLIIAITSTPHQHTLFIAF